MSIAETIRKLLRRSPKQQPLRPPSSPRFKPAQPAEAGRQVVIGGVPRRRIEPPTHPRFREASPAEYGGGVVIGGQPPASKHTKRAS